jgi:hypothetical protein
MSYKSSIFQEKRMAGARSLWHATGTFDAKKPLIAVLSILQTQLNQSVAKQTNTTILPEFKNRSLTNHGHQLN